ncbi:uncharacterized protein Z520_02669 [Fonsecaea multimorphosa CBS 102226]|uniref:Shikimate dehydrogenase substrate binding N-terminal domain-containing protein n=1 Tax=Fonsecaea multimorphosa CBS 102226 TaxID=1442371 RepID=A0A0D2IVN0_9EURO|nr:uncharacterized protein Z520_02669 [Fonsecaea multimorphosa CBS 102226]KIY01117.1 hypothetical protein Z520_02669 [Fonsecaea multimorphosa CBS 102226]OAL28738.1 hypothetical protein AYO22_02603 [Fonsecaea multimorphosa]
MIAPTDRNRLYIGGGPGGGSTGPKVHEYIAQTLGLDWTCEFLRVKTAKDLMEIYRRPDFAGGLVTMPHKMTIIPLLDQVDDLVRILRACNIVYRAPNGALHGSNTDWVGIRDCLLARSPHHAPGRPAMVYGAGGASRAAVYALAADLACSEIYLVNRDDQEVVDLLADVTQYGSRQYSPQIRHVRSTAEAKDLRTPSYIVSTVPDFDAVTPGEIAAREILVEFLSRNDSPKGLLLDMCYHPVQTRNIKLAQQHGWRTILGYTVSAAQFAVQWRMWTGKRIEMDEVYRMTERIIREREALKANGGDA